jgi:hypothetical protein
MTEDTEILSEMMLAAERFCNQIETRNKDVAPNPEEKELHAKLGLCRTQLAYLQNIFDNDRLNFEDPLVREGFRHLIIALMWVAFYSRSFIDFKLFRKVVLMEASFTYLLLSRRLE